MLPRKVPGRLPITREVTTSLAGSLSRLRPRIAALVIIAVGALAALMAGASRDALSRSYDEAGRTALRGIAKSVDDGFTDADLRDPADLQRRVERLKQGVAELHKVAISWRTPDGAVMLVQAGHAHDATGAKRELASRPAVDARERARAAVSAPQLTYREVRAATAHYARLDHPLGRSRAGAPVAVLELHYDLALLDRAADRSRRTLVAIAVLGALTVALLLVMVLTRVVVDPMDGIRAVANRIRRGEREARLGWTRKDEFGDLARDFDRMADAVLEAEKDPITGLLNHRAFQERLGQELARSRREATSLAVVVLDVDDFRAVNEVAGHGAGDAALRRLAQVLATGVRPFDLCGRLGGDEFAAVLVGARADDARGAVERMRGELRDLLTVSAGVASFPEHAVDQEGLLRLAGGAMYRAKSAGKNRVVVFEPEDDSALSAEEAAERNLRAGLVQTVHALARAVDAKDGYTHAHSHRVGEYAVALGAAAGIPEERLEKLRTAGVLHDIGKIGIPDAVLLKEGRLDDDEFAAMQRHSALGHDIIAGAGLLDIAEWVLHLHERVDGRGYPGGICGDAIPLESRILHCADALEAMTSSRVYRRALPVATALGELERGAGTQFDDRLARMLVELVRTGALSVGERRPVKA